MTTELTELTVVMVAVRGQSSDGGLVVVETVAREVSGNCDGVIMGVVWRVGLVTVWCL